jgi:hypothetical protein
LTGSTSTLKGTNPGCAPVTQRSPPVRLVECGYATSGTDLSAPGDSLGLVDGPGSNSRKGRMGKGNRASELNCGVSATLELNQPLCNAW